MLLRIVSILFPIFAIVAAGYWYGRRYKPEMSTANHVNMIIFVPALVFSAMVDKSFTFSGLGLLMLGALVVLLGSGLLAWPVSRAVGIAPKTFVPPMMFNNSGNMGLPLAHMAWGEAMLPAAVVLFIVASFLHFSLGVRMLSRNVKLQNLWREPLLLAALAGVLVNVSGITLWTPLMTGLKMLGDVSIPLLLFALGVRLTIIDFADWRVAMLGAVFRPVVGVALAWAFVVLFDLEKQYAAMLIVFGALPPAVFNFLLAERYHQEPERVAAIVMIGNLAAILSMPLVLYLVL